MPDQTAVKSNMWRHLGFFLLSVYKMWLPEAHCVVNRRNIPSISCLSIHPLMFLFSGSSCLPTHSLVWSLHSIPLLAPKPLLSEADGGPLTLTTWFRRSFISLGVSVLGWTCCPQTFTGTESEPVNFWVFPKRNSKGDQHHNQVKLS